MQDKGELFFVHGFYQSDKYGHNYLKKHERKGVVLLKDSFDSEYVASGITVELSQKVIYGQDIVQGNFVYYNGETVLNADFDPSSVVFGELNNRLSSEVMLGYENNKPTNSEIDVTKCYSYHVNVGHGNCSILVFYAEGKWFMWVVDCSIHDFMNGVNYSNNMDRCLSDIKKEFHLKSISKLLISHLHYDHINGIEYLIRNNLISPDTEIWMNTRYPWKQQTYNRILLKLLHLGVHFIDPVICNSTRNLRILYPYESYDSDNLAPARNINNASVLYQICLGNKSMLFTGDIETEGWQHVTNCYPNLRDSTYYCLSHHGSINGFQRTTCPQCCFDFHVQTMEFCTQKTAVQILMGRDGAYPGIYSKYVLSLFHSRNLHLTENTKHYLRICWDDDEVEYK